MGGHGHGKGHGKIVPPFKETNNTTVFSDRVDGSLYVDDKSAAVVNPADKVVDIIGEKSKRGRSRQGSWQKGTNPTSQED